MNELKKKRKKNYRRRILSTILSIQSSVHSIIYIVFGNWEMGNEQQKKKRIRIWNIINKQKKSNSTQNGKAEEESVKRPAKKTPN